jgi:hypothetical protein
MYREHARLGYGLPQGISRGGPVRVIDESPHSKFIVKLQGFPGRRVIPVLSLGLPPPLQNQNGILHVGTGERPLFAGAGAQEGVHWIPFLVVGLSESSAENLRDRCSRSHPVFLDVDIPIAPWSILRFGLVSDRSSGTMLPEKILQHGSVRIAQRHEKKGSPSLTPESTMVWSARGNLCY